MDKENEIHLGINIGAMNTVYSKCFRTNNNNFVTEVLLSDFGSRTIPSQICYTNTNRLYGEKSNSKMNKFLNTSYFNISRFIGFVNNNFFNKELEYLEKDMFDGKKFKIYNDKYVDSSIIIADYLSLINDYFIKQQKIQYNYVTFSVPDYYTLYQKNNLKTIAQAIRMENINIINESTAITMYYGYTKYNDLFKNNEKDNEKHVIFIDSGHSKTSFIYSIFKKNEFQVKKVKVLPSIGGRNFDKLILNECINHFKKENSIKDDDPKFESSFKLHKKELLDAIIKAKKNLSVNEEIDIIIDPFIGGNIALNYTLTRVHFEKLIESDLNKILDEFKKFIEDIKIENIKVEMSGELMRIPRIQQLFEIDLKKNIKISKTIIIDECLSLGASLYSFFKKDKNRFPIKELKKIIPFNYYDIFFQVLIDEKELNYQLYQNNFQILLENIELDMKNIGKKIKIGFKYDDDDILKNFCPEKYKFIYLYKINIKKLKKDNEQLFKNSSKLNIKFVNIDNEIKLKLYIEQINVKDENSIDLLNDGIFNLNNVKKEEKIISTIKEHDNFDNLYNTFIDKKNMLIKLIYKLKERKKQNNNNKKFEEYNEKIKNIINDEKIKLEDKIFELEKIKEDIEKEIKIKKNNEEIEYENEKKKFIEKIQNIKHEFNNHIKEMKDELLNDKSLYLKGIKIDIPKQNEENNKTEKAIKEINNKNDNFHLKLIFFDELIDKINNIPFNEHNKFEEIKLNLQKIIIENLKNNEGYKDYLCSKKFDEFFGKK